MAPTEAAIPAHHNILTRLPAGLKAGSALVLLVGIAAIPYASPGWLVPVLCIILIACVIGRISISVFIRRLFAVEIIAVTTSVLALFQPDGWHVFLVLLAKSTLSLATAVVFSLSISFIELLGLLRSLHFPGVFVTTVALLYRYLFVLTDQAGKMMRARASRTFVPGRRRAWILNSGVVGMLAVRSVERAEHVFDAMRARGWR